MFPTRSDCHSCFGDNIGSFTDSANLWRSTRLAIGVRPTTRCKDSGGSNEVRARWLNLLLAMDFCLQSMIYQISEEEDEDGATLEGFAGFKALCELKLYFAHKGLGIFYLDLSKELQGAAWFLKFPPFHAIILLSVCIGSIM